MVLAPRLELRQSQTLVMTPQLQQAIKLLQLSNLDLSTYVEQELERNPLLERDENAADKDSGAPAAEPAPPEPNSAQDLRLSEDAPASGAAEAALDTDYDSLYSEDGVAERAQDYAGAKDRADSGGGSAFERGGRGGFEGPDYNLENTLSEDISLTDHLLGQLGIALNDPAERIIGAMLIDSIDEAGYLVEDTATIAARLGCDVALVERILGVLQGFDPVGLFARDLAECLALQLRERDRLDPIMTCFLEHLDLLANHDISGLARVCGADAEDVADMITEIRALNPKPGLSFGSEAVQPIVPDVFVRQTPDGGWSVELNSETLPRVLVNNQYHARVSGRTRSKEDRIYLAECLTSANWLVKSLNQRATTILKVSTELVRQQDGFLAHGVTHLRPLNLKTIADAIEMHESTVSRVTSNKYMATPRGIFELKYFFTSAIAATEGEAHSAETVRYKIRELIEAEEPARILSDDKIVELLGTQNIEIARRTVAKYREAMRIPSSVQRRRVKRAASHVSA